MCTHVRCEDGGYRDVGGVFTRIHIDKIGISNIVANDECLAAASLNPFGLLQKATASTAEKHDFAGNLSTFLQRLDISMLFVLDILAEVILFLGYLGTLDQRNTLQWPM